MRGCRIARRRILLAVDQSLPLEERFLLEEHLTVCDACSDLQDRTLGLEEALARLPEPPEERLDVEQAVQSVRLRLEGSDEAAPIRAPRRRRLAFGLAAAALVSATAVFVVRSPGASRNEMPAEAPAPSVAEADIGPTPEGGSSDVESILRAHLRSAFEGADLEREDVEAAATRFEELASDYRRWPLARMAEKLLDDSESRVVASAARYLGVRGDRISATCLAALLSDASLAPVSLRALGDLGRAGVPALAGALDDPALAVRALPQLGRVQGPEACRAIERALLVHPGDDVVGVLPRDSYYRSLAECGPSAVETLLRLSARDELDASEARRALAWLDRVDRGDEELVRLLRARADYPAELLLEAIARLQPEEALPWVEERACERHQRAHALACLVRWNGTAPLEALLRLDSAGGVPDDEIIATFGELARRDRERVLTMARVLVEREDLLLAGRYLELLVASGSRAASPALVHLALAEELSDDDRQWAALAAGEVGSAEDGLVLLRGLTRLGPDDRRLYAASLITIDRLLGEEGTEAALEEFAPPTAERIQTALDAIERQEGGAVRLSRVARALDGALARKPLVTWKEAL